MQEKRRSGEKLLKYRGPLQFRNRNLAIQSDILHVENTLQCVLILDLVQFALKILLTVMHEVYSKINSS